MLACGVLVMCGGMYFPAQYYAILLVSKKMDKGAGVGNTHPLARNRPKFA